MKGRRTAALLGVLLTHALVIFSLLHLKQAAERARKADDFVSEPITLFLEPLTEAPAHPVTPATPLAPTRAHRTAPSGPPAPLSPASGESAAITPSERVDWPIEGKKAAARVLARAAEAERVARMFAGPGGTWASLTKRQRSKLNKFRFKPGIDGLEYDEKGNKIYHISDGCVIVNSMFIACALGKPMVHDDMFDNMRLYFDEQRLPETDEGNGTEPEALRPANK